MARSKLARFLMLFLALPCFLYASHAGVQTPPTSQKRSYSLNEVICFVEALEEGRVETFWDEQYLRDMRMILIKLSQIGCKEEDRAALNRDILKYLGVDEYVEPSPFEYEYEMMEEGFHQTGGIWYSVKKGAKKTGQWVAEGGEYVWEHKKEIAIGAIVVAGVILTGVAIANRDEPGPPPPGNPYLDDWYYPDSEYYDPNSPDSAPPSYYEDNHIPPPVEQAMAHDTFTFDAQDNLCVDVANEDASLATMDPSVTQELRDLATEMGIVLPEGNEPLNDDISNPFAHDYGCSFLDPNQQYSADILSYHTMGQQALDDGLYDQAAQDFSKIIELSPDTLQPYLGRSLANFAAGNYEQAIKDFNVLSERVNQELGEHDTNAKELVQQFALGAKEGLADSATGIASFVGDCIAHPVNTAKQVGTSFAKLVVLAYTDEWGEISKMLVPEVYEIVTKWDDLSAQERSHMMGHALTKNGGDIVIPAAAAKVASKASKGMQCLANAGNEIKLAHEMLALETAAEIGNATKIKNTIQPKIASRAKELGFNSSEIAQLDSLRAAPKRISGEISFTNHALKRAVERGVTKEAICDAIQTPLKVEPVKIDHLGRPSQRFIGQYAEVVVNPDTQGIVSVNPTSTRKAEKLINGQSNTNAN